MAIGIDFGYSDVKIIQLEKSAGGYTVQNIGKKRILDDFGKFDPETVTKSHWTSAIMELCREMRINPKRAKHVVSSVSGSNVSVRQITTLEMSDDELASSLEFEAKKHIPMDGTHAVMDFHVLGSDPTELDKVNVLLVATSKNIIQTHDEIMKDAGFRNGVFDADPISLVNTYLNAEGLTPEGVDVILNVGMVTTSLVVWGVNQSFFTRELGFGGHHFSKATAAAQNMKYMDAEVVKIRDGIKAAEAGAEKKEEESFGIKVAEKTVYTHLVEEIRKTLRYYMKTTGQSHFNKFYISGGSAATPGLKEFIAENLNVEIQELNPFLKIESKKEIENKPQYAVALGCALRGIEKKDKKR